MLIINILMAVKDFSGLIIVKKSRQLKMTINTQDFWKIMFDELDKTSQKDWKKFVKKHDKKYKKKKLKK